MNKQLTFWIDVLRVIDLDAQEAGNNLRSSEARNLEQPLYVAIEGFPDDTEHCKEIIDVIKKRVLDLIEDQSSAGQHEKYRNQKIE